MLEFNIRNQEISRIDNFSPAEKSVEYLIAKFNFKTDDWNEAIKRAVFRNVKSKVEKDAMLEDDSCVVPWELLVGSSDIEVSVHGVIGTKEITSDVAVFNLNRTLQGGSATQEPSPTVYAQMVEMVKDAKEVAQSVRNDADNGKFSGIPGEKGEDGKSAYQYAVEGGFKGTEQEFIDSMGTAGGVDLTGYVSKEQHEAELLKAMVKVTTDKAPFHHITDSANMKVLDFGMEGITEQRTTPGNQLFDISKFKSSEKQVAINNGDGSITMNQYQFTADSKISECCPSIQVGQTIIISAVNPGKFIWFGGALKQFKSAFEVTQAMLDNDVLGFYGTDDTSFDNPLTISDIMINEGTTVLPYEPFTNGASPNPTHPQEIKLAGVLNEETGRYEHKCVISDENEENSQPFTLTSDRPLTMWDKLVKRDGVWGWSIWSKSICHTSLPTIDTVTDKYIRAWRGSGGIYEDGVCNILRFAGISAASFGRNSFTLSNNNYTHFFIWNSILEEYGYVYDAEVEKATNAANAKTAFAAMIEALGGITITGKTKTEQAFIPLPDEEQTLLNNLETYYGVTNVYNEQGCPISITYCADQELHWNQKLLQIQQAII